MEYKPYYYQDFAEKFILDNPEAGLLLDMGMGKTVTSLSAADKLLNDYFAVSITTMLTPAEFEDYSTKVLQVNGFQSGDEMVEEAKN